MLKNGADFLIEVIAGHPSEIRGLADIREVRRIGIIVFTHAPGCADIRGPLRWFISSMDVIREPVCWSTESLGSPPDRNVLNHLALLYPPGLYS